MCKRVPCLVYSRIVGYIRPTVNWNDAKRLEFEERKTYRVQVEHDRIRDATTVR